MPLLRVFDGQWGWGVAGRIARGELKVRATGDTRDFRYPPGPPEDGILGAPCGIGVLDGDLLVYGWKPLYAPICAAGLFLFIWALGSLYLYAVDADEASLYHWFEDAQVAWGWQALIGIPLGFWMFLWYPFKAQYPRLVIFDRRRGLVHVPRWFGRRLDAVRFAEVGILAADIQSGYMGRLMTTMFYVVRPGWSLGRGEYPPWRARIGIDGLGSAAEDNTAEQSWRLIVTFMTEPPEASEWLMEDRSTAADAVYVYGGDWAAMRRAERREFRRLYGSELLTEPNWVLDAEGRWQRRPGGPRERIELPDGPEEKRVPV